MPPADPAQVCALLHTALAGLAAALEDAPATPLRAVQVLGEAERAQVLDGWNDTAAPVPAGHGAGAVRGAGGRGPGCGGGGCAGAWLSYRELDAAGDRLARLLAARGAGPEQVVAVCWSGRRSWWWRCWRC